MDKDTVSAAHLLRLIGLSAIAVGGAWAVQTLGFSASALASRLLWVVAAASISGAGAGLLIATRSMPDAAKKKSDRHDRLEPVFD